MKEANSKTRRRSIKAQQKALKKLVLSTPIEEILPNKNRQAVENLKRAGLVK